MSTIYSRAFQAAMFTIATLAMATNAMAQTRTSTPFLSNVAAPEDGRTPSTNTL